MKTFLNLGSNIVSLKTPLIMGILNITPDSFYKDSRINPKSEDFLKKADEMIRAGVSIFDIGGHSTRPGSVKLESDEELSRILPAVKIIKKEFPEIPISIDTFSSEVAEIAIQEGVEIINDISGGDFDPKMFDIILKHKPTYILMHLSGDYNEMHRKHHYENIFSEVLDKTFKKANYLRSRGLKDLIIDPGFGFSKSIRENYDLLNNLELFTNDYFPVLVGLSRKSMIYKTLDTVPENTLVSSSFLNGLAAMKGAKILRVHDVKDTKNIMKLYEKLSFNE